jgi:hypothetical protein
VKNYNGKNNLEQQSNKPSLHVKEGENNEELKKDRIISAPKMVRDQVIHFKIC